MNLAKAFVSLLAELGAAHRKANCGVVPLSKWHLLRMGFLGQFDHDFWPESPDFPIPQCLTSDLILSPARQIGLDENLEPCSATS